MHDLVDRCDSAPIRSKSSRVLIPILVEHTVGRLVERPTYQPNHLPMKMRQTRNLLDLVSPEDHRDIHLDLLFSGRAIRELLRDTEAAVCDLENHLFEILCGDNCLDVD